jgi:hypothetical protein
MILEALAVIYAVGVLFVGGHVRTLATTVAGGRLGATE